MDWRLERSPTQPPATPWPTAEWPEGPLPAGVAVDALLDEVFAGGPYGTTYAVVVVQRGRLVAERYGGAIEHWDRPSEPVDWRRRVVAAFAASAG